MVELTTGKPFVNILRMPCKDLGRVH